MPKRPLPWQLAKQRTAKGLREYPPCEEQGCAARGMGWIGRRDHILSEFKLLWVCPCHAAEAKRIADQKRANAPRES